MNKEKKEIGKLLELLNEYEPFICGDGTYTDNHWGYVLDGHSAVYPKSVAKNVIISKSYGFIEWLVREDKIERPEIRSQGYTKPTYGYTTEPYTTCKSIELTNTILMILAIQDKPIEFLCSLLK